MEENKDINISPEPQFSSDEDQYEKLSVDSPKKPILSDQQSPKHSENTKKDEKDEDSSNSESSTENLEVLENEKNPENFENTKKQPNTSLLKRLTVQEKISSLSEFGIEISVSNPIVKSTTFRKHILYTVSGSDSIGGFHVLRRYKEFLSLRKVLVIEWPGCSILQLPPKQAMVTFTQGNLEQEFVEKRRKLLEYFIKNLTRNYFILTSEEFQLFLRGPENYHKTGIANRSANYNEIALKYKKVFEQYSNFARSADIENEIREIGEFITAGKNTIESLEKNCSETIAKFKQIDNGINKLVFDIQSLKNHFSHDTIEITPRALLEDPYSELLSWCRNNLLEIKGLLECLNNRTGLERTKTSFEKKIEDEKKSILKRQSGKKKIVQFFNKKPSEFYINQSENNIKNYENLISSIDVILNISSAIVRNDEFPLFKITKINTLDIVVDLSGEKTQLGIEKIIDHLKELADKV